MTRPWPTALVLATAMFLVLFDSLAVATALPHIGEGLGLGAGSLQWVVSLFSLSIGGLLVLGGRLCDLWGRRRMLLASIALSTAACLLAGLAQGLPLLLTGRALQGVGAAFAIPAALASAATLFPEEPWHSRVFSIVAASANSAGLAGAVVGGLLTAELGWRWVFLAPVPVGAVALVATSLLVPPDPPRAPGSARLDLPGALLATGGLVALIYGVGEFAETSSPRALVPVAIGVALLGVLVVVERRVADPLVKPRVVRSRRLIGSCIAFGAHSAAYAAVVVIGSVYLQDVHGLSAAGAGLVLAPVLLAAMISAVPAGALTRRFGSRVVVTVSLALCAGTLAVVAFNTGSSLAVIMPWLIAWGLSAGPVYVGLTRECIGDAAPEDRGTASALFESTTHVGGAVSIAAYLPLLGAGFGYAGVELIGVVVVAAGAIATFLILPGPGAPRRQEPAPGR